MNTKLNGILTKNDKGEFTLFSPTRPTQLINLSNILNKIYCHDDNFIEIQITNTKNNKILYLEKGLLYYSKLSSKKYVSSVEGQDLETVLLNNIGNELEIEIFSEVLERTEYGQTESKG